jgi:hypothetical protein
MPHTRLQAVAAQLQEVTGADLPGLRASAARISQQLQELRGQADALAAQEAQGVCFGGRVNPWDVGCRVLAMHKPARADTHRPDAPPAPQSAGCV